MGELFILWGREVLTLVILLPIVWYLIKKGDEKNLSIVNELKLMRAEFKEHTDEDTKHLIKLYTAIESHNRIALEEFKYIKRNMNNALLDKEQTIDLLKTHMWYITGKKLEFIKNIILNNHIKGNEDKIREKVYNGLVALSDEYLSKFSTYNTPIGDLGKWLNENFSDEDFKKLVDDIIIIIYREDKGNQSDIITNKISEISLIMRTLQVSLTNKLRAYLK